MCSELLVGGEFTFDLDAKITSATAFSMLELASCRVTDSGHTCCLHSAEISVTYQSSPRLMTTHDVVPSALKQSICTSMPWCPLCSVIFASWKSPQMVLSPNTPVASAAGSSRMAEYPRQIEIIRCCASKMAGRALQRNVPLPQISRILLREKLVLSC